MQEHTEIQDPAPELPEAEASAGTVAETGPETVPEETSAETMSEPPADEAAPEPGPLGDTEQEAAEVASEELAPEEGGADEKAAAPKPARKKERPAWPAPPPERLEGAIEAILLVAGDVVRLERLRDLLGLKSVLPLREAIAAIRTRWQEAGLATELEEVAGGVRVVTRPEYAEYVARLLRRPPSDKLSRTQLETLCIVAYKQPVGRAEVERIRGVQAGEPLRALLERRLLKVVGRSDQPGRPLLYGTTQQFLTAFGLKDVKDLPSAKDLQRL